MSQERYQQIDALAEAALKMENAVRSDFLHRACGSDQDLLVQVNALLRAYETADDFLERPALEAWAGDVAGEASCHCWQDAQFADTSCRPGSEPGNWRSIAARIQNWAVKWH